MTYSKTFPATKAKTNVASAKFPKAQKTPQQLDLSYAAALVAIKHYYQGAIDPSELERDVLLDEVYSNFERVIINFHGFLGENRQSISLPVQEYRLATQLPPTTQELSTERKPPVTDECSLLSEKAYLEKHHAFLKSLSNVLPEWDLYARIPGELTSEHIGRITCDCLGRFLAMDVNAITVADLLPSKIKAIEALILRHAKKWNNQEKTHLPPKETTSKSPWRIEDYLKHFQLAILLGTFGDTKRADRYPAIYTSGQKYYRICLVMGSEKTARYFVDKQTGDVYMAASWKQKGSYCCHITEFGKNLA